MPLLHYSGIQPSVVGTQDVNNDQELLIAPYLIIIWRGHKTSVPSSLQILKQNITSCPQMWIQTAKI